MVVSGILPNILSLHSSLLHMYFPHGVPRKIYTNYEA
jgi:hypothetical protein